MNLTPLKRKLLRGLTRTPRSYRDVSDKHWVVCPAETYDSPSAIYLDGDLDKITAVMEDTTYEREMRRIRGGRKEHAATRAYLLTGVELLDGLLYKGAMRHRLLNTLEKLTGPSVTETIADAALACTLYGSIYFGHWMTDDLTLHLAAMNLGIPIIAARRTYGHEPEYCRLFGINRREVARVKLSRLVMLDDAGQNRYKRERYAALRSRLRAAACAPGTNPRIYIRRGSEGAARSLVNSEEIESYLEAQGFTLVDPDCLSAREIVQQTNGARLVLGLEGSHMIHGLFNMAETGVLCIMQPPYRFNNVFKDYTDCLEIRYASVVGRTADGGFTVPLEDLQRILDRIDCTVRL